MDIALSGFNLGTVLLGSVVLFPLASLFFGTRGGYYNTDKYDGNGCLLYTSPSPRDQRGSRMPSSA